MSSFGTALLGAWLLSSSPVAAQVALPEYPGTRQVRIGNELVMGGEHFRLAYFLTTDGLEQVTQHFRQQWRNRGLPVRVEGDFGSEVVISAFHTREGVQQSVVLRRHADKTLGFSVLRDLWREAIDVTGGRLPAIEGALFAHSVGSRTARERAFQRTAFVKEGLARAQARLDASLKAAGFRLHRSWTERDDDRRRRQLIEHRRGGEQLVSTLLEVDSNHTVVSQSWAQSGEKP